MITAPQLPEERNVRAMPLVQSVTLKCKASSHQNALLHSGKKTLLCYRSMTTCSSCSIQPGNSTIIQEPCLKAHTETLPRSCTEGTILLQETSQFCTSFPVEFLFQIVLPKHSSSIAFSGGRRKLKTMLLPKVPKTTAFNPANCQKHYTNNFTIDFTQIPLQQFPKVITQDLHSRDMLISKTLRGERETELERKRHTHTKKEREREKRTVNKSTAVTTYLSSSSSVSPYFFCKQSCNDASSSSLKKNKQQHYPGGSRNSEQYNTSLPITTIWLG